MYKIEKKSYGFRIYYGGTITADEARQWVEDSKKALETAPSEFCIFADNTELNALTSEAQKITEEGQKLYKDSGMVRSVVVLRSPTTIMQLKKIGKKTGIYRWERYIDASTKSNWEKLAEDWLVKAVDPDLV